MNEGRRIQRLATSWPTLHLEAEVPPWAGLVVDGAVRHARHLTLADLRALGANDRDIAVHCVWGWSRPDATWLGVDVSTVLSMAGAEGDWVTVTSASNVYSACLPILDAGRGVLAWERDGEPLSPEAGGPLRFVAPADYWAYKGVKWAARLTVTDTFRAGPWESKVADPIGLITEETFPP